MGQTAIYLDPDLDALLKIEAARRKKPAADLLREALKSYLAQRPKAAPPGAGAFDSGHIDTAGRAEEILDEMGFGEDTG